MKYFLKRLLAKSHLALFRLLRIRHVGIRLPGGARLRFRTGDFLGKRILQEQAFESETCRHMRALVREGMTVLDIGANFGFYTVQLARWVGSKGRVIAFEPNPVLIQELEENVRLNGLTNVTIKPVALSDVAGDITYHCPSPGLESHGSLRPNSTFSSVATIRVSARTLDDVLIEMGLSAVDFIKMDVEGAERSVFRGAPSVLKGSKRPAIIFECAEPQCRAFGHCVLDLLIEIKAHGYALEEIDHAMWCATPETQS